MPVIKPDEYELSGDQRAFPLVWVEQFSEVVPSIDVSDAMLERAFGPGTSRKLKSWGHSGPVGVHWLATRSGTPMHTDPAYSRYTHHLILRNDGFRLRGLEDRPDSIILRPGAFYCLDAHSPHQVVEDKRLSSLRLDKPVYKLQVAFDTDEPWSPGHAIAILFDLHDDPNEGAEAAAKTAPAPRSGARP
jgi:hypothetical protein